MEEGTTETYSGLLTTVLQKGGLFTVRVFRPSVVSLASFSEPDPTTNSRSTTRALPI